MNLQWRIQNWGTFDDAGWARRRRHKSRRKIKQEEDRPTNTMAPSSNPNGSRKQGSKKISEREHEKLKSECYDVKGKYDAAMKKNRRLSETVQKLEMDKAELTSQLEAERKKNGEIVLAGTEQLKLNENQARSVGGLVQQKIFLVLPLMDKTMFHEASVMGMVATNLRIEKKDWAKYAVEIRKVCIRKTTYWRDYLCNQLKKEYISKCYPTACGL